MEPRARQLRSAALNRAGLTPANRRRLVIAMDKAAFRQAIVEQLEADLAVLVSAANASKDEATNVENKAEGTHDMRGQSAAYLATGQAKLATEIGEAISAYRLMPLPEIAPGGRAVVGTLVVLESEKRKTHYFIGPARGGIELDISGTPVTVITAASPLGRQLLGRQVGEGVSLGGPRASKVHVVVGIE